MKLALNASDTNYQTSNRIAQVINMPHTNSNQLDQQACTSANI